MSADRCQFCGRPADGLVRARGLARPILYCPDDDCWEQAYALVRLRLPRSWEPLPERKTRRATGQAETLFDL
jgi:hypothetical protein